MSDESLGYGYDPIHPYRNDFILRQAPIEVSHGSDRAVFRDVALIDATLIGEIPPNELKGSRIIAIDGDRDAIRQIHAALADLSEINVLRIISHGSEGTLWFGEQRIDAATLAIRSDEITGLGNAMADGADILIYGCEVASTDKGRQLIRNFASLTGADIAANTGLTGSTGDVSLDYQIGEITNTPNAKLEAYKRADISLCTRVLWNTITIGDESVVLSGRSQDWFKASGPNDPSEPKLLVMPRGLLKSGAYYGRDLVVPVNPVKWKSRYGSLVVANENRVVMEGMNEKGLAAHALAQPKTEYGHRDESRKGIQMGLLVPYILDNAATVDEAIELIKRIQPVSVDLDGFPIGVSLVFEDRLGDSAIIEFLASESEVDSALDPGVVKVYQGRDVRVFANLDYAESLATLKETYPFDVETATRNTEIPGNGGRIFRFVRASFFNDFLTQMQPETVDQAKAALMSAMRSVSNPIGAPGDNPGQGKFSGDETNWRTLSDLTNRVYTFDNARTLTTFSTNLRKLDFRNGSGVRVLDPSIPSLGGDVTRLYRIARAGAPGLA
jgi:penicillin V acylase-like amidase (Ntn superfamily)